LNDLVIVHLWKTIEELKEKIDRILTQISQCLRSDYGRFFSAKEKYQ
jgi:hypothetical protein